MKTYGFEKLEVWQLSRIFAKDIYLITKNFPDDEKFGLISQLRRAAISISSNIAEGNSRLSNKDKAHFFQISFSSLMEVLNQLIISNDLEFINNNEINLLRLKIDEIANKLNALHKSILK